MKKRITYFLSLGCLLLVMGLFQGGSARGCVAHQEPAANSYDSVLWSGWSSQERLVSAKAWRMLADHVKHTDGRLFCDLSEAEFRKINLPDTMHRRLIEDLKVMNRWLDSLNKPAAERIELYDDYIKHLKQTIVNFDYFCKIKGFSSDWYKKQ